MRFLKKRRHKLHFFKKNGVDVIFYSLFDIANVCGVIQKANERRIGIIKKAKGRG